MFEDSCGGKADTEYFHFVGDRLIDSIIYWQFDIYLFSMVQWYGLEPF